MTRGAECPMHQSFHLVGFFHSLSRLHGRDAGGLISFLLLFVVLAGPVSAQDRSPERLVSHPATLEMALGEAVPFTITALDGGGNPVEVPVRVVAPLQALQVVDGVVTAMQVGEHRITVTEVIEPGSGRTPLVLQIPVTVSYPPVTRLELVQESEGVLYAGTTVRFVARAFHADGSERPHPEGVRWTSRDPGVVQVDRFGSVTARAEGEAQLQVEMGSATGGAELTVVPLPAVSLELSGGLDEIRTGDVVTYRAIARDEAGREVADVPITWSLQFRAPDEIRAPSAPGQLREGRFVADVPGEYTVLATAGPLAARQSVRAVPRDVIRRLEVRGQGRQDHVRTTDLWVFEGLDGRDYAITGAKMSDGYGYVFDVTDPTRIVKTDSIRVDARSINDAKVSPDGRYATMTREGASDRRNGLVVLDLADPAHPVVAAEFTEGLTGGVHNAFPLNDHVFALSGGDRYLILDMSDIYAPRTVSEVRHGDCRIHDVWVHDGVAYSAQWGCGVIAYDVGNGRWGGSLENPVYINSFVVPDGATHAVFPYYQESTGKFYLFVGDERMNRRGLAWEGISGNYQVPYDPETGEGGTILSTRGYIQIIDFTDPQAPEMVARYEVTEYGTHNIWVEDDILYQAYYEGGLRVVDVSGELMGNLYTQGREIAVFRSADPIGYVPNSPMVWSAMPFKGHIFFSDTNSGIWAVRLEPEGRPVM